MSAPFVASADRLGPYLDGLRHGELRVTRCAACQLPQFPPRPVCPGCAAVGGSEWFATAGRGQVWSFCIFHKAYLPEPAPQPRYNVAVIQLNEGPKLISTVTGVPLPELRVGMAVRAVFPDPDEEALVRFRPLDPAGST
ncbi:MAG: OB-fold domain-containing protein [Pseudonocardia sp.]|nr:OB-fold domain-containing protein [Pseudonocardia sp.]